MDVKYTAVYRGENAPRRTDVLWVHHSVKNDLTSPIVVQSFSKGRWVDAYDKGDQSDIERLTEQLGDITTLETTAQDSVVNAINEVVGNIGDLDDLTTTEKTTLVGAINDEKATTDDEITELNGKIKVLEDILGITLEPDLDEKYYQYFTIEATEDGTKVYFRQSSYAVTDGIDPLKVEVSADNGETWTEVTAASAENDVPGATLAELDEGDKVLIRGKNEAYGYFNEAEVCSIENCNFYADKPCYVYGNIMSLVSGDDFARLRKVKEYAFANLFSDYDDELDHSWVLSKEGEKLLLPATTLADYCYEYMFNGCTSLTVAPELPATTLADYCYEYMFLRCTGLTTAPELPATTLASNCYSAMFNSCTDLTTAPELPATTLANSCYNSMFYGCTGLTTAPELPATTLANSCYNYMFYGCSNISYIKAMFTTTPGSSYTNNWVTNVKATGTFVKNSAATWDVTGVNGVPSGWTVETADA